MKKLAQIKPELLLTGLFPSVDPYGLPLWAEGQNVMSRDNAVTPIFGHASLFTKPASLPVLGVETLIRGGKRTVVWGDRLDLWLWQEGDATATNVTRLAGPYTGTDNDRWSIQSYGEAVIATNGVDVPQYLAAAPATDFVNLNSVAGSNYPALGRAKIVFQDGPFVLFFNLDTGQINLQWSDEDSVTDWTPTAGNLAGDLTVRDLDSEIIAVTTLGSGLGIYGRDQVHLLLFQGAPLVYAQGHALSGIGACGKHAIAPIGRVNYGMGPRGIFKTDGVEYVYLDEPAIHRTVYDDINENRLDQIVVWPAITESQIYFAYPSASAVLNDRCISLNYKTGAWWVHGLRRTAAAASTVFTDPITATENGDILEQNIEGQPITAENVPIILDDQYTIRAGYGECGYGKGGYGGEWSFSNYQADLDDATGSATVIYVNVAGVRFNLSVALDTATCYLETKDLDLDAVDFRKALQGIMFAIANLDQAINLRFRIRHRNSLQEAIQDAGSFTFSQAAITRFRVPEARYYRIRIEDLGITTMWRLSQMEFFGQLAGKGPGV